MKEKNTVRYSRDHLPKGKTHLDKVKNMSEDEIEKAALADPDNPPWTKKMLNEATLVVLRKLITV